MAIENYKEKVSSEGIDYRETYQSQSYDLEDAIKYTVGMSDRIDILAKRFYGDPSYWYIIADANQIENPLFDLKPGKTIYIPRYLEA